MEKKSRFRCCYNITERNSDTPTMLDALNLESIDRNNDNQFHSQQIERTNNTTEIRNREALLTPDQPGYRDFSQKTFLGSKFHGSRRHLRALSENGLIVVSEKGQPHLFITLTTNTEWPEIKDHLFFGQTAFDR